MANGDQSARQRLPGRGRCIVHDALLVGEARSVTGSISSLTAKREMRTGRRGIASWTVKKIFDRWRPLCATPRAAGQSQAWLPVLRGCRCAALATAATRRNRDGAGRRRRAPGLHSRSLPASRVAFGRRVRRHHGRGVEAGDDATFDAIVERLEEGGVRLREGSGDQQRARRVERLVCFEDPDGNPLEAFSGPRCSPRPFQSTWWRAAFLPATPAWATRC